MRWHALPQHLTAMINLWEYLFASLQGFHVTMILLEKETLARRYAQTSEFWKDLKCRLYEVRTRAPDFDLLRLLMAWLAFIWSCWGCRSISCSLLNGAVSGVLGTPCSHRGIVYSAEFRALWTSLESLKILTSGIPKAHILCLCHCHCWASLQHFSGPGVYIVDSSRLNMRSWEITKHSCRGRDNERTWVHVYIHTTEPVWIM